MSIEAQDIIKRSATNSITPPPQARDHKAEVAKLIDVSTCISCKARQVACSEQDDIRDEVSYYVGVYDNLVDPGAKSWAVMRFTETEQNGRLEWLVRKDGCMHYEDPGCLKVCPSAGAIVQYINGIVDFQSEHCTGYGYCTAGCLFNTPCLSKEDSRVYKCMLHVDRVSVGQEPVCVKTCPTGAIHFNAKQEMLEMGKRHMAKLKACGFEHAGLYNPEGVDGTHVMYALHHANQPELYHGPPKDSRIDTLIDLRKEALKPPATAGFIATFARLTCHYISIGPNKEVDDDEEDHHEQVKNGYVHEIHRLCLSLDGGNPLFPSSTARDFIFLPDSTMVDASLRYATDGTCFASVLRHTDLRGADVHVCTLCAPQHPG